MFYGMELMASFATIIASFLGLLSLQRDIENFVSTVQVLYQTTMKGWRRLVQTPKGCNDSQLHVSTSSSTDDTCFRDHDDLGRVSVSEVNVIMSKLGMESALHEEIAFGSEELGSLFDELEPSLGEIREAFGVFDVNKDGYIDALELQRVVCELGLKNGCGLDECERMIRAFDCNGDRVVDFSDFIKLMEKCLG